MSENRESDLYTAVTVITCWTLLVLGLGWVAWLDRFHPQIYVRPSDICGQAFATCLSAGNAPNACSTAVRDAQVCPGNFRPDLGGL